MSELLDLDLAHLYFHSNIPKWLCQQRYQYHLNDDEFNAMMDNVKDAKLVRDTDEEEVSGTIH